jgi:hypothetical protein
MNPISVLPGYQYAHWTVVEELPKRGRERLLLCRCDCGRTSEVLLGNLRSGKSTNCAECRIAKNIKHGLSSRDPSKQHRAYDVHCGMMQRCYNPDHRSFQDYGGRGITVSPEWHDAGVFCAWVDANLPPRKRGETINRIDNDRGYEPGNVEWSDWYTQNRNRRGVVLNPDLVSEIRRLHREDGLGGRRIGRKLELNEGTVNSVLKGESWPEIN